MDQHHHQICVSLPASSKRRCHLQGLKFATNICCFDFWIARTCSALQSRRRVTHRAAVQFPTSRPPVETVVAANPRSVHCLMSPRCAATSRCRAVPASRRHIVSEDHWHVITVWGNFTRQQQAATASGKKGWWFVPKKRPLEGTKSFWRQCLFSAALLSCSV